MAYDPDLQPIIDNLNSRLNGFGVDVHQFGALGDGVTDDAPAIQAAINSLDPNRGGHVLFRNGRYRIATGLTVTYQGTWLIGQGSPGTHRNMAQGSTRIISDSGVTAITCGTGSHGTLGYGFRNLHVLPAVGATSGNGIVVNNAERTIVENVTCSDYVGGFGFRIHGQGGNAQYAQLSNFSAGDCMTGLHLVGLAPNGMRLFGGFFQGAGVAPRPGSKAIYVETGDTSRIMSPVIQGYETGIHLATPARGHAIVTPRFEYCNVGVRIGPNLGAQIIGGTWDNTLLAGGESVGIRVDAGASGVVLIPGFMSSSVTTKVDVQGGTSILGAY